MLRVISIVFLFLVQMMLRVISIVYLFLVRVRFPSNLSTIQMIRNRYDTVKLVRQIEKLDYKYPKLLLDLSFLENCIKNNVTPKFGNFGRLIEICEFHLHIGNVSRSNLNKKLLTRKDVLD